MLDAREIHPLTDFLRNHKAHVARLKESGTPEVLTVNKNVLGAVGVKLARVMTDTAPPREFFDPSSPLADEAGMVKEPSVNPVYEMVDMMQAARSYQANLSVVQTANAAALKTIDLLK